MTEDFERELCTSCGAYPAVDGDVLCDGCIVEEAMAVDIQKLDVRLSNAVTAARLWRRRAKEAERTLRQGLRECTECGATWVDEDSLCVSCEYARNHCPLPAVGAWEWVEYPDGTFWVVTENTTLYIYTWRGGFGWDCFFNAGVRKRGEVNGVASTMDAAKRAAESAARKLWEVCCG